MNIVTWVSLCLTILGALIWMIIGIFSFNLVTWIFGAGVFARIIYVIVGIAAIWLIARLIWKRGKLSTI